MASGSEQSDAIAKGSVLTPVMTLQGHDPGTRTRPNGEQQTSHHVSSICYFPDGEQMISGSDDKTARRWDLRAGKEIKKARDVHKEEIRAVTVSRDGRWVVTAGGNSTCGELKVREVETGIVRKFEAESHPRDSEIEYIDISPDSTLLASGTGNSTVRIWNLGTGKLIFEPSSVQDPVGAVRFSHDSKKLVILSIVTTWLDVWDVETQKLDVRVVGKAGGNGEGTRAPVFWTTNDKTIVAIFNFTANWKGKTVYEFDASTLETVGAPFDDYGTNALALSFDCALLASASWSNAIKLWAFESRQLLASFDVQNPRLLILSPNSHQLAYTLWYDTNCQISICDIPPDILATGALPAQKVQPDTNAVKNPRLADLLNSDATPRVVRRKQVIPPVTSSAPQPPRPSPVIHSQRRDFFRYLRTVLPSGRNAVRNDQPRDPLDFPATSPLPPNHSPSAHPMTRARDMNPHQNPRSKPAPAPITQSLHHLSSWWPFRAGHALPPIVNVPLAPGKLRNAAAGAPAPDDDDLVRDEDYVPPAVPVNTGTHGRGRLCGCF